MARRVLGSDAEEVESLVGASEVIGPAPLFGKAEDDAPRFADDAPGGVEQAVAQRLGLGPDQLAVEAGDAEPGEQVGAGEDHLQQAALAGPNIPASASPVCFAKHSMGWKP